MTKGVMTCQTCQKPATEHDSGLCHRCRREAARRGRVTCGPRRWPRGGYDRWANSEAYASGRPTSNDDY